ncbi:MAG: TetR/AcrR family transcriptional regulator [Cyclobacteriaceae bacterium]
MAILSFSLSKNLYVRDPQATELGQKIVQNSISLIDKLGFEDFTFKKLAKDIGSTEASVYRYFENKHKLLIYLIDWYWTWMEYKIDYEINNIKSPTERLKLCLLKLSEEKAFDPQVAHVDERALDRIMIAEFEKTFLTKQVDEDNKEGLFLPYKSLCKKVASVITEVSPHYPFPHSLTSTVLLMIKHQLFYARHLPALSDIKYEPQQHHKKLYELIEQLVFKSIH